MDAEKLCGTMPAAGARDGKDGQELNGWGGSRRKKDDRGGGEKHKKKTTKERAPFWEQKDKIAVQEWGEIGT